MSVDVPPQVSPARPRPVPDERSAGYWAFAADRQLALARCAACGALTLPPDVTCPSCSSTDPRFAFVAVSGAGRVRSWTVVRRSFLRGFDPPFALVDVELDGATDVRLVGRLLDGPEAPLAIGARVVAAFEDLGDGVAVPAFRLADAT